MIRVKNSAALQFLKYKKEVLVATGNHDLSNGEGKYSTFAERFMDYNNMFFGSGLEKPYYYRVIEGCYFIILSTEDTTVDTMYISDEQLQWLGNMLSQAEQTNSPVFVMNHYPVDYIEGRDFCDLADVLNDYDNLLYFCGHTHDEYSEESIYEAYGINCINLPKCTEHAYEDYDTGIGAQVEVYDGEIVVRIRDFYDGIWLEEYTY